MSQSKREQQKDHYADMARSLANQDIPDFVKQVDQIPDDDVSAVKLNVNRNQWDTYMQEAIHEKMVKRVIRIIILTVVILMALFIGAAFVYLNYEPIRILVNGTATPMPTLTSLPTITPTATQIPTATLIPPTPTSIPDSQYLQTDLTAFQPTFPITGQAYWLLKAKDAQATPDFTDSQVWAPTGTTFYTGTPDTTIRYSMDYGMNTTGIYALYIVDSAQLSFGDDQFVVTADGQTLSPFRGTGLVHFNSSKENVKDSWKLIGFYQITAGQLISVSMTTNSTADIKTEPYTVSDLMIVQLSDTDATTISEMPTGRPMTAFWDDLEGKTAVKGTDGQWTANKDEWMVVSQTDAWQASFHSRPLAAGDAVQFTLPAEYIPTPGSYQLVAWIPANSTAEVSITVYLNDVSLAGDTPIAIDESNSQDQWVSLGKWDLAEAGKVSVSIEASASTNDGKTMGVDAFALLQADD
jgi:hypothetical protein